MPRVLAFDPGFRNLGIAVAEPGRLIHAETLLVGSPKAPLKWGARILDHLDELRIQYGPFDAVVFETPPMIPKNVKTSALLWHVMGAVTAWSATNGYPVWDIMPQKLKRHCCRVLGMPWNPKSQPSKTVVKQAVLAAYHTDESSRPRDDHADDAALAADAWFAKNAG